MRLDDVYVIGDKLDLATEDQITAAERALGTCFPTGYRDYVTTLGEGTLNEQVRVLPPTELVERTEEYRDIEAEVAATAERDGFSRWELVEQSLDLLPPRPLARGGPPHRSWGWTPHRLPPGCTRRPLLRRRPGYGGA